MLLPPVHIFLYYFLNVTVKSSILLYGLPDVLLYILLLRLQLNFIKTSEKPGNQVVTYIYIFTSFPIYWLSHPHTFQLNLKYPIK